MNPESQQEQQKKIGRKRKYSDEFRQQALERIKGCDNVTALAEQLGIRRNWLYEWRSQAGGEVLASNCMAQLERLVARQALEIHSSKVPCSESKNSGGSANRLPTRRLPANRASRRAARPVNGKSNVWLGAGEPGQ